MHVIETVGLTKIYGSGDAQVAALKNADLRIESGEMVAIMGPSGSGKSTLLCMLGAVETPTSGSVLLEGEDLATLDDTARTIVRRRRIGFVFQSFNLLPNLTALENVGLPLELDGVSSKEAAERSREALTLVEMSHRLNHFPGTMSGGEQQRVALARALVIKPAIVLADEPTGALDSANSQLVMKLLRNLVDEHRQTVILVTHDPNVGTVADRVIYLCDGEIDSRPEAERIKAHEIVAEAH